MHQRRLVQYAPSAYTSHALLSSTPRLRIPRLRYPVFCPTTHPKAIVYECAARFV
jgi:hypothetical protein